MLVAWPPFSTIMDREVRGDMKAVITAILFDVEARGDLKTDPNYGHLREPVLYIAGVLRAFNATSDGDLNGQTNPMGQRRISERRQLLR